MVNSRALKKIGGRGDLDRDFKLSPVPNAQIWGRLYRNEAVLFL
jgi:hypothetical protein